ncbi:MAG: extracellular solute-binding protein [Lachnospiraceae bacterium]|nr:extracellular solute-binding protein [Lachnospiraceae bacterium]
MVLRKNMKRMISLLLAASMVFSMAGCGGNGSGSLADADNTGGSAPEGDSKGGSESGGEPTAMGRYVEEQIDLSEQGPSPRDLCMREDGSLVIMDYSAGMLVSNDQGAAWTVETPDWFAEMKADDTYISSMYMAPDGTVAVLWGESTEDNYQQYLKLILPDGTQVPVETELTEDEAYFCQVAFRDDGVIFASTNRSIYEVERDGSCDRILALDYNPHWIWVRDNLLVIDNDYGEDLPAIYDLETGEYIEDEVLVEFVSDNYQERHYNGRDYASMHLLPGEDGSIYVIGKKGIHRHVIGGNMMEQIVDGNLSLLSNPNYYIVDMMQLEGDVFLALFTGGKLIRFTYDPDVPSVPENIVTIYSLREDTNIRQAVSRYQTEHPDVFMSYEIGMDGGDSVTREDAIKKLNTEIMAGEGPDLLVMDGLPFDSYVDKGMLLDLTDHLKEYSTKEPLFDNVIEALKRDGKAYVAPATIAVPQIASAAEGMEAVKDLAGLGELVERMRTEYPEQDIVGVSGASGILKRFAGTSAPKWVSADGAIDRESIGEYLEQCKRIFDAQMDGLDESVIEYYDGRNERMSEYLGMALEEMDWEIYLDVMSFVGKEQKMMTGWNGSQYAYLEMVSLDKNKGLEDAKVITMQGQCTQVFKPATMLAVSAASAQPDAALRFLDAFLSAEVQGEYDGFPLNQDAFDIQFTPRQDIMGEDGEYASMYTSDADGNEISYICYWPSDEQIAAFKQQLASVNTAYIPDLMVESAVFKQGANYMRGELSLDQALDEIEKAVAIYMAE